MSKLHAIVKWLAFATHEKGVLLSPDEQWMSVLLPDDWQGT